MAETEFMRRTKTAIATAFRTLGGPNPSAVWIDPAAEAVVYAMIAQRQRVAEEMDAYLASVHDASPDDRPNVQEAIGHCLRIVREVSR